MAGRPPREASPTDESDESEPQPCGDEAALDAFCARVSLEDMEFSAWRDSHQDLDLMVTVTISAEEAQNGCVKQLSFVRTVKRATRTRSAPEKVRVAHELVLGAGVLGDTKILLKGLGDQTGRHKGNLKITIRIK